MQEHQANEMLVGVNASLCGRAWSDTLALKWKNESRLLRSGSEIVLNSAVRDYSG